MTILVDSTVLIDAIRGRRNRQELLDGLVVASHDLAATAINIGELYAGVFPSEMHNMMAVLSTLDVFAITEELGRKGGQLKNEWARRGRTLALDDAIIAAVAITHDIPLLTDNVRDFPMPELKLWPLPQVQ